MLLGQESPLFLGYNPVVLQVHLVGEDDLGDIGRGLLGDLPHPLVQAFEGGPVINGVGEDDARGSLLVGLGDGPVAFLAGSVPDLQLEPLVVDGEGLCLEVNADGGDVVFFEGLVDEVEDEVGLADAAIPDYDQLGQNVVGLLCPACHIEKLSV